MGQFFDKVAKCVCELGFNAGFEAAGELGESVNGIPPNNCKNNVLSMHEYTTSDWDGTGGNCDGDVTKQKSFSFWNASMWYM